jgi:polysaccharide export outer membrane protein
MLRALALILALCCSLSSFGESYTVKAGDVLDISVWGEEQLEKTLRVLPDGSMSFPLVGSVSIAGLSVEEAEALLAKRIGKYISAPDVSIIVAESEGSRIYVLGNVTQSGSFPLTTPLTAVQALALAGGLGEFADKSDILILRDIDGEMSTLEVNYSRIVSGRDLSSNHRLMPGDTILVP